MVQKIPKIGSPRAWIIWSCAALFYCYQFIIRVAPNVMSEELMNTFALDATGLGALTAYYYYAYASMQIPLGLTLDRFGPRFVLAGAGIICAAACFLFSSGDNLILARAARFMMGMGSACGFISCLKLGTVWFRPKQIALIIGLTMVLGTSGGAIGGYPLEILINLVGWQQTFYVIGILGFAVSIACIFIVQDEPKGAKIKHETADHLLSGIILAIKSPQVWKASVFGMLMYVPLTVIGDQWGVPFLSSIQNISEAKAASMVASMFFGIGFGGPIFAWISDFLNSRTKAMTLGAVVTLIIYSAIVFVSGINDIAMYLLLFLAGTFFNGQCLCFASCAESLPKSYSGVAVGFTNMIVMFSGIIFLPLVGYLLDSHAQIGPDGVCNGYESDDFRFAFLLLPLSLAIALGLTRVIKDTYPKNE